MPEETECQQAGCIDTSDLIVVPFEEGGEATLCEDHAHMTVEGKPVDGYEPNDPSKFS